MRREPEAARRLRRFMHRIHRPGLALGRIAAHFGHGESVKTGVIGGMHGDALALQMSRKLRNCDAVGGGDTGKFIAVILTFGGQVEIE